MSRASSPDNEFVDVESTDRPHSSASGSSQKHAGPSTIPPTPEVKRNRGRPRKTRDNLEDGKQNKNLMLLEKFHNKFCSDKGILLIACEYAVISYILFAI